MGQAALFPLGEASQKGGLLALFDRCTHLGCRVLWRPDYEFAGVSGWFYCPCHFATFTKGGLRVIGPAPRSMDTFQIVAVGHNGVRVNTGHVLLGGTDDAQRTVPAGPFA
jgi:cytochrome b6-f complex iron-sulfur subunit